MRTKALAMALLFLFALATGALAQEYGVFVKARQGLSGPFDRAVSETADALKKAGWEVLASYENGVPEDCGFRAHTLVIYSEDYARSLLAHGPRAAFALPLRVSVYEDETGINVAFLNPASLNRTVLGDGVESGLSRSVMEELATALAALEGHESSVQIGQLRTEGHVGGMGGGDFADKVQTIYEGGALEDALRGVNESIEKNTLGWKKVYEVDAGEVAIVGIAKSATEAKAFGIAGEKRRNDTFRCPGLDHAAAFPIEVVLYTHEGTARVEILDEMYRMKVYFEDAGRWAFMKNMTMPGHIEDEVVEVSTSALRKK
ncbi:MAG: DUF302 domain-containing protein [Nitrospirota bacterium]